MNGSLQVQKTSAQRQNRPPDISRKKSSVVLVVESDEKKRGALKTLLDLYDVRILETGTGEEAVDLTVQARPDLVLMNTRLPRLDGFEAARLIRTIKSFDDTPIIFLSNQVERAARKRAFSVGGNAFHVEPLDLERLDAILENYLLI